MTLYEEIVSKCSAEEIAEGNYHAIAAKVNIGRTKSVSKIGGIGYIMTVLGPVGGAAVLDALEAVSATNSAVKWAMVMINAGTLDFGLPSTHGMIDTLVAGGVLSAADGNALKASTTVPDEVSWNACNEAVDKGV